MAKTQRPLSVLKSNFFLLLILIIGALFRFYGIDWDQGQHLHPDERFLTMLGNAMRLPATFFDYLNPQISTFNPTNIGYRFFVYGIFPLVLNKVLAFMTGSDNYALFTIQGRFLSALFDLLIVFLVYKTVELFEEKYKLHPYVKYFASFFYAIAVLPIQLSHFFAVDTFLNTFMFSSFYFALRFSFKGKFENIFLSAIFFGLALASKISAVFIFPLNALLFLIFQGRSLSTRKVRPYHILAGSLLVILYVLLSYIFLRFANPYYFNTDNLLDPTINTIFIDNIKTLRNLSTKDAWYPPAVQWIHKPPMLFSLINLAFFGVGLPYFVFIVLGFYCFIKKPRYSKLLIISLWIMGFFLFQSTQFVKTLRYFIFLYPFLAIFAGMGFYYATRNWNRVYKIFVFVLVIIWPLMFFSIYTKQHSRVEASEWVYENLEDKSMILGEYWDDPLPLQVQNTHGKSFRVELLPVFDPDTPEKWQRMGVMLQKADYLVFSSNRGWGSIPTVPEKYPLMSKFYQDLFAGRLAYKKIREFTSYPSLRYLGVPIEFADDWADESFTVYDHPKVIIFKKQ